MHAFQLRPASLKNALVLCTSVLLLPGLGCSRFKQQIKQSEDNNPQLREAAVASARKSCVQAATAKAPRLPGMDARIATYCDCFATKGLSRLSNSELTEIGLHAGHYTPDQQAKLMQGVQLCQNELLGQRAAH